jgi:hypothetical protein
MKKAREEELDLLGEGGGRQVSSKEESRDSEMPKVFNSKEVEEG